MNEAHRERQLAHMEAAIAHCDRHHSQAEQDSDSRKLKEFAERERRMVSAQASLQLEPTE